MPRWGANGENGVCLRKRHGPRRRNGGCGLRPRHHGGRDGRGGEGRTSASPASCSGDTVLIFPHSQIKPEFYSLNDTRSRSGGQGKKHGMDIARFHDSREQQILNQFRAVVLRFFRAVVLRHESAGLWCGTAITERKSASHESVKSGICGRGIMPTGLC